MHQFITETIRALGYPGVALLLFLENIFPPLPSELIIPFAGMLSSRDPRFSFWGLVAAGTLGALLGALVHYEIGRRIAPERLREWISRHGFWLGLEARDIDRTQDWFERHGASLVLFGRLVPGVRSFISIPAGMNKMHPALFLGLTAVGSALWTALLAYAGRLLGANYEAVERFLDPVGWTLMAGFTLAWLVRVTRRLREDRQGVRQRRSVTSNR